jgi:hypothetical protein
VKKRTERINSDILLHYAAKRNAAELRRELAAANVTVLTSSGRSEVSLKDDAWQHGAFTRDRSVPLRV